MQLVEQQVIKPNSPIFAEIDAAAFAAKNLYNATNYVVRQAFFATGTKPSYPALAKQFKDHEAYTALPRKVLQWVLKTLDKSWKAYFAAHQEWRKAPSRFFAEPKIPKYKDKESGRNLLVYTIQAISGPLLKIKQIKLSGLGFILKTKQDPKTITQVRIVPKASHYVVEVVYDVEEKPANLDYTLVAGIDMGIDNLAAITSNKLGFVPILVNGRPLKSINQFYNQQFQIRPFQVTVTHESPKIVDQSLPPRNLK